MLGADTVAMARRRAHLLRLCVLALAAAAALAGKDYYRILGVSRSATPK